MVELVHARELARKNEQVGYRADGYRIDSCDWPTLCADFTDEGREAMIMLLRAHIPFHFWDGEEHPPADWDLPFVIVGRAVYGGLEAIRRYVDNEGRETSRRLKS